MSPRLVLLCGLSFSGKSTLARRLAERFGAAVVSLDEINARRGLSGGDGLPVPEWAATHRLALGAVEAALAAGSPLVVVDDTFSLRFLRDDYRALARRVGADLRLAFLDVPPGEIAARRARSEAASDRPGIREEVFAEHAAGFERPGADEPHLALGPGDDADAFLERLAGGEGSLTRAGS